MVSSKILATEDTEGTEKEKDIGVSGEQEVGIRGAGDQEGESRASSTRAKKWCEVSHPTGLHAWETFLSQAANSPDETIDVPEEIR